MKKRNRHKKSQKSESKGEEELKRERKVPYIFKWERSKGIGMCGGGKRDRGDEDVGYEKEGEEEEEEERKERGEESFFFGFDVVFFFFCC